MSFFLLLVIVSMHIDMSLQSTRVMELRAPTTCTFKNPENPFGPSPVGYGGDDGDVEVDVITVKFGTLFKEGKCNRRSNAKKFYPKVQYREVGRGAWNKTESEEGKKEFEFENLNPCAAYEVRVKPYNKPEKTFTVGPYFDEPNLYYPIIDDENEEYKKSFRRMRTTPKSTSVKFNLTICAKLLQFAVEPEREKGQLKKAMWSNLAQEILAQQ